MMKQSASDFVVDVEGVGTFRFAQKNLRIQAMIEAEYSRLTEGLNDVPEYFQHLASVMAELKVLAVEVPEGWDIDAMDPETDETYQRLWTVWGALRDKRAAFRAGTQKPGAGAGKAA